MCISAGTGIAAIRNHFEAISIGSHDISVLTMTFHGIVIVMFILGQEAFRSIHARVGIAGIAGLARSPGIHDVSVLAVTFVFWVLRRDTFRVFHALVGSAGIFDLLRNTLEEGNVSE